VDFAAAPGTSQSNPEALRLSPGSSHPFQIKEKEKESMKVKEVFAQAAAKLFDVTPEKVEEHFRTTGLSALPEFEAEMPAEKQAEIETMDMERFRLVLTAIFDAVGVSMNKIEKTIKKG
jgi:hypothetical protein